MGRHSAPDDDVDDVGDVGDVDRAAVATETPPEAPGPHRPRPGRHATPAPDGEPEADAAEAPTAAISPITPPAPDDRGQVTKPRPGILRRAQARTAPPRTGPRDAPPPRDDDTPAEGLSLLDVAFGPADTGPVAPVLPDAADETVRIPLVADPVLDEPVPSAVTDRMPPVPAEPPVPPVPAGPAVETEPGPGTESDTESEAEPETVTEPAPVAEKQASVSDLALLRRDAALRARVLAAVVAPAILYVVVLLAIDSLDVRTAFVWIWIPLVTAGVLGGLLLDRAHSKAGARRPQD